MSQGNYTPRRYGRSEHTPIVIDMVDYGNGEYVPDDDYSYSSHYSYSSSRQSSPRHATQQPRSSSHSVRSTHSSPRQAASVHDFAQRRSFMMGEYEEPDYQQEYDTKHMYTVQEEQANSMQYDYNNYVGGADCNDGANESEYRQSPGLSRNSVLYEDNADARDRAIDARSFNGTQYNEHENHRGYVGSSAPVFDDFNIPQDDYDEAGDDDVHTAPGRVDRHQAHEATSTDPQTGSAAKKVFYFDIDDLNQRLLKSGQDLKSKSHKKKSRSRLHKKNGKKSKRNLNYYNMEFDNAASEILQVDDDDISPSHRSLNRTGMNVPQRGFALDDSAVGDLQYTRDQKFAASDKHAESHAHLDRRLDVAAQRNKLVDIVQRFSHLDTGAPHHRLLDQAPPVQDKHEECSTPPHSPRGHSPRNSQSRVPREALSPRVERTGSGAEGQPGYTIDFETDSQDPNERTEDRDFDSSISQDVKRLTLSPRSDLEGQIDGRNSRGGYNSGPEMKSTAMYDNSFNHISRHDSYGEDTSNKIRSVFEEVQQHVADLKKNPRAEKRDAEATVQRADASSPRLSKSPRGDELRQKILGGITGSDYAQTLRPSSKNKNELVNVARMTHSLALNESIRLQEGGNPDQNKNKTRDGFQVVSRIQTQAEASGATRSPVSPERPQTKKDPEQRSSGYFSDNSYDIDIEAKKSLVYVIEEDQDGQSVVHVQNTVLSGGSTLSNTSLPDVDEFRQDAIQGIVAKLRDEALMNHGHGEDRQDPDGVSVVGGPLEPNGIKVVNIEKYDECESYKALGCNSTRTMEESKRRSFLSGDLDDESEFKADMDYACMDLDEEFEKVVHVDDDDDDNDDEDDVEINFTISEKLGRVVQGNLADDEEAEDREGEENFNQDQLVLSGQDRSSTEDLSMNIHEKHMSFQSHGSMGVPSRAESADHANFFLGSFRQSDDHGSLLVGSISQSRSQVDRIRSPGPTRSGDLSSRQQSTVLSANSNEGGVDGIEIDIAEGSYKVDFAEMEQENQLVVEVDEEVDEDEGNEVDDNNEVVSLDYDFNRAISASSHSSSTVSEQIPAPSQNEKQSKFQRTISAFSASSDISSDLSESVSSGSSYDSFVSIVESEESDLDFLDEPEGFAESFMSSLVSSTFGWIERKQEQLVCGFKSGEFDGPSLLRESMTRQRRHPASRSDNGNNTMKGLRPTVTKKYMRDQELPQIPTTAESKVAEGKKLKKKSSRSEKKKTQDETSSPKIIKNDSKTERGRSHSIDIRGRNQRALAGLTQSEKATKAPEEEKNEKMKNEELPAEKETRHRDSRQQGTKHRNKHREQDSKQRASDARLLVADSSVQDERNERFSSIRLPDQVDANLPSSPNEKASKKKTSRNKQGQADPDVRGSTLATSGSIESVKYNFDFLSLSEGVATAESINTIDESTQREQEKKPDKKESKGSSRLKSSRGNAAGAREKKSLGQKLDVAKAVAKGSGKGRSHTISPEEELVVNGEVQNNRSKSRRASKSSKRLTGEATESSTLQVEEGTVAAVDARREEPSDASSANPKHPPESAIKRQPASLEKNVSGDKKSSKKDKPEKSSQKESTAPDKRASRSRRKAAAPRGHHTKPKPDERDENETEEDHILSTSDGERDKMAKERRRSDALKRRRKLREKRRAKLEQTLTDDTFG